MTALVNMPESRPRGAGFSTYDRSSPPCIDQRPNCFREGVYEGVVESKRVLKPFISDVASTNYVVVVFIVLVLQFWFAGHFSF